jgi:hypothetical protein
VRADAAKKFYGSCQGDAHAFNVFVRCWLIRVIGLQDIYNIFVRTARRQRAKDKAEDRMPCMNAR